MSLLDVKNLKTYFRLEDGRIARAVDGVSFSVEAGRTLAVVGESGCGKSQTAFSIMRLVERNGFHPEGSMIRFGGTDLMQLNEEEMRRIRGNDIAMIFQEPMSSLNPLYRVGNQLCEPLRQHQKLSSEAARRQAIELLKTVGIPAPESRIDNFPHEMSGGMKQRVMIAMALACKPRLLIADEPTTALDVTIQAQILTLMKDMQRETGMGMILITHDLGIVSRMADDVCVMYGGRIAEYGTREDIFTNPQHPYTRRLLESIPDAAERGYKLRTIPGIVPAATDLTEEGCRFADRCAEAMPVCTEKTPLPYPYGDKHAMYCHLAMVDASLRKKETPKETRLPKPPRGDILLETRDLCTWFPVREGLLRRVTGVVKAVDNVSLTIRSGETLALVGESGCGKTTVGQSILRLIDEARGTVRYKDISVLDQPRSSMKRLRKDLQIVFQDPFGSLSPRMKTGAIIAEGLRIHFPKMTLTEREERLQSTLKLVGLDPSAADRFPHEFSGGQRQRIAIARALILEPEFLVLDEPTSALDVSVQAQILNLLEDIQTKRKLSYLFITHNLGVVEYLADHVAVMYLGRIVERAPTATLFADPKHPYTQTLLEAVPKLNRGADKEEFPRLTGDVPSPLNPPAGCHFHPRCPRATEICRKTYPSLVERADGCAVACHHA